jgi:hypothetical protein
VTGRLLVGAVPVMSAPRLVVLTVATGTLIVK